MIRDDATFRPSGNECREARSSVVKGTIDRGRANRAFHRGCDHRWLDVISRKMLPEHATSRRNLAVMARFHSSLNPSQRIAKRTGQRYTNSRGSLASILIYCRGQFPLSLRFFFRYRKANDCIHARMETAAKLCGHPDEEEVNDTRSEKSEKTAGCSNAAVRKRGMFSGYAKIDLEDMRNY